MGQTPYHGPHVVLDPLEAAAIKKFLETNESEGIQEQLDSVVRKVTASQNSHPDFLKPAK